MRPNRYPLMYTAEAPVVLSPEQLVPNGAQWDLSASREAAAALVAVAAEAVNRAAGDAATAAAAASDATSKANAAQAAAIAASDPVGSAATAQANAISTAASDATSKANAAQAAAIAASQPVNANLTALAGQTGAADKISYWTGAATLALASFTSWARTLLGAASASAAGLAELAGSVFTGMVTLPAGTTAAGTAPLKMQSGPLLTAPEVGAVEFLTDKPYLTITTGTARKEIALADSALTAGRIPFTTTNGRFATDAIQYDSANKWLSMNTTPTTTFEIGNPNAGLSANMRMRGDANSATKYMDVFSGTVCGLYGYGAMDFWFGTAGTQRMIIKSDGRIGFNRADPIYAVHNSSSTAKTTGGQTQLWFMSSNEAIAGQPFGLLTSITGAAANANRIIDLSTTEYGVAWAGNVVLQRYGGSVGIGTGNNTPAATLDVAGTAKVSTSLAIGGGTALTKAVVYTPTLTPNLIAGQGYTEQTFTVAGLTTADTVQVCPPAAAASSAYVSCRVSAADTIALTFATTALNITPSSGTYRIIAFRS